MKKSFLQTTFYTILVTIMMVPFFVFGQETEFKTLVGIPGVNANQQGIEPYINALFILAIAVAAISAVIRIILAGVSYMFSEVVTDKGQAKKDIIGAVLGLLLILGGVTILNEINPNLTSFSALRDAKPVTVQGGGGGGAVRQPMSGFVEESVHLSNAAEKRKECTDMGGTPDSTSQGPTHELIKCWR